MGDVRVGIIGTGIMGSDHAATLHRYVSGGRLAAVSDVDAVRAQTVADAFGARALPSPEALIADDNVDAVIIASPDPTHADLVRACVAAGKPVLCEKPLATTLEEASAVIADLGEQESLVALGFMRRFDPGYVDLKSTITAGGIGTPVMIHSVGRGVSGGPGRTNENSVTNSAIHDLDIVPWLLGSPVVEVSWHAPRRADGLEFQDPQLILLRTADGVLSTVDIFLNARYGYDVRCEVIGDSGIASLTEPARIVTDAGLNRSLSYGADWRRRFADAYRLEQQAWVDAIRGGDRAGLATACDGLQASLVADAVITSMHNGGAVTPVPAPA